MKTIVRTSRLVVGLFLWIACVTLCTLPTLHAGVPPRSPENSLTIPRLPGAPVLENFLEMKPEGAAAGQMTRVKVFTQAQPHDGAPASQRTEAYLGYDSQQLYFVFVCFDAEPGKVRAHMNRRENIDGEEQVQVYLDTFHDHRRAYAFATNPLGVQLDMIWTESQGPDTSFDTVWQSRGKRTGQGYVVWMAIPFKSLRFPASADQHWGILLERVIPRSNEDSFWPAVSAKVEGRLSQEAELSGLQGISPGRNLQIIPYGVFHSFHQLDLRDSLNPTYHNSAAGGTGGLDAKMVLKDSLVLDGTFNPDFSQVESDEPQLTANQRFAVFFPEKRPFFLENSDFFQGPQFTSQGLNFYQQPINFVFTRNIENPEIGVRLTGKRGHYSLGLLLTDDRGPGETVANNDPLFHKRAHFAIARVQRDFGDGTTLGVFYTDREFEGSFNRVGGVDARIKLGTNWVGNLGGSVGSTLDTSGAYSYGSAYDARLQRVGRKLNYDLEYHDTGPGFITNSGFFRRPDIRRVVQNLDYRFRPEGKTLISWGPSTAVARSYDSSGQYLDELYHLGLHFEFPSQTFFEVFAGSLKEALRPKDFSILTANQSYGEPYKGFFFGTSPARLISLNAFFLSDAAINFNPPSNTAPFVTSEKNITAGVSIRPLTSLAIDNTYLYDQLRDPRPGSDVFTNHIIRSKWNYQFTRELSARLIFQYTALLSNPNLSALDRTKNFSMDFLITYLIHPGTALYIGYNSNLENVNPALCQRLPMNGLCDPNSPGLLRRNGPLINDGREFFIKLSYLFRF
jgi:uncharacterized protein DUF5916